MVKTEIVNNIRKIEYKYGKIDPKFEKNEIWSIIVTYAPNDNAKKIIYENLWLWETWSRGNNTSGEIYE